MPSKLTAAETQLLNRLKTIGKEGILLQGLWSLSRQPPEDYERCAPGVLGGLLKKNIGVFAKLEDGEPRVFYMPIVVACLLADKARENKGDVIKVAEFIAGLHLAGQTVLPDEVILYVDALFKNEFVCRLDRGTVNYPNKTQQSHLLMAGKGAMTLQQVATKFGSELEGILSSKHVHIIPVDGVHEVVVYSEALCPRDETFADEVERCTAGESARLLTRDDALDSARARIALNEKIKKVSIHRVHGRRRTSKASKAARSKALAKQKIKAVMAL